MNEKTKEILKLKLTDYVNKITTKDTRSGKGMYKCPLCNSGALSGSKHNGAFSITPDGLSFRCFSCTKSGDIFSLIGFYENIRDFKNQLERACEIYGISFYDESAKAKENLKTANDYALAYKAGEEARKPKENLKTANDYALACKAGEEARKPKIKLGVVKDYVLTCKENIDLTDYFERRGFNKNTIEQFNLGFDSDKKAVIIPYGEELNYYIARSVHGKVFRKPKSEELGVEPIFNLKALYEKDKKPCFICESPIDAISIMQTKGDSCRAISLGGTGFRKLLNELENKKPSVGLILSFDLDEPGCKASEELSLELLKMGIFHTKAEYSVELYPEDKRKDVNDFLVSNSILLEEDIKNNVLRITELLAKKELETKKNLNKNRAFERLESFLKNEKRTKTCIKTGFNLLDKELDNGLYPGLYVLGAISSLGKTTFLLQIADQVAKLGSSVLYFSLEMSALELISKSISRETHLLCDKNTGNAKTTREIMQMQKCADCSQDEKKLVDLSIKNYKEIAKNIFFYEGVSDIGTEEIKNILKNYLEVTGKTPVVFIDYLQVLAPFDARFSDKQNTDRSVLELKRISRDYEIPIVGISSFNRESYLGEVTMASFKESGAIEYGSDVLIALEPEGILPASNKANIAENMEIVKKCKSSKERAIELVILKNRNGKTGSKIKFKYYSKFNYFEELEERENTDSAEVLINEENREIII